MENLTEQELNQILEGSPSSNIYNELNKQANKSSYDDYCKSFKKINNNGKEGSYDLCIQIARNAENLSRRKNERKYIYNCLHYTYWLYYKIKTIFESKLKNDEYKSHIETFLKAKNSINTAYYVYSCQDDLQGDILQELNKKVEEKYLFDYFENYDTIKTHTSCQRVTFDKYKKYLSYISTLYEMHKNNNECCKDPFWSYCLDYFKCNSEFDPKALLKSLEDKGNKKCDILKQLEKPSTSVSPNMSFGSQKDFIDSNYFFRCTYIRGDNPEITKLEGGKLKCDVLPASQKSLSMEYTPFAQPPPNHVTFTTGGKTRTLEDTKLQSQDLGSSENSEQQSHSPSAKILTLKVPQSIRGKADCPIPGFVKDVLGKCREPSVRETGTIGLKLNTYHPEKTRAYISFDNNSIYSSIFKNNVFRVGIAFTLIVGIFSIIFIYYKFTPFGRSFHKKVSRKKRINDYYDDPHMRHFIIRAPKSVKRKVGDKGLRFSYYSR
ncbi:hypothetical protein MKS88_002598 [Plasmodium brasilianum]|uniref:Uncharacterized protein n=1 Tax=Plasmodium brasilianum TaxID=5824 RepID=A0ACB9YD29_PLABR|nr:hypothetical protein MKS88_002598 [Plasmodium brasilianum]